MQHKVTAGQFIRRKRHRMNMSQQRLAQKTGLSRTTICNLEHDRFYPKFSTLVQIVHALGFPMSEFLANTSYSDGPKKKTGASRS